MRMKYVPDGASALTDMSSVVFTGPLLRLRLGFENRNETPGGSPLEEMFWTDSENGFERANETLGGLCMLPAETFSWMLAEDLASPSRRSGRPRPHAQMSLSRSH